MSFTYVKYHFVQIALKMHSVLPLTAKVALQISFNEFIKKKSSDWKSKVKLSPVQAVYALDPRYSLDRRLGGPHRRSGREARRKFLWPCSPAGTKGKLSYFIQNNTRSSATINNKETL
jgi:hypothetical protein